jgi:membrane protease YdiL (CAAX protease family)
MHGDGGLIDTTDPGWTALDLVVVLVFLYVFWPLLASGLLFWSGWFHFYYGHETVALATDEALLRRARDPLGLLGGPLAVEAALPLARQLAQQRLSLWAVVALPFQVVTVPLLLWRMRGTHPEQLGLTTKRLGRNLLLGLLAWLVLTPLVLGVQYLTRSLFQWWPGGAVQEHPLVVLAKEGLRPGEWALLVFATLVAAPVLEELVFRGALQGFFVRHRHGGAWAMVLALAYVLLVHGRRISGAAGISLVAELLPVLFVLLLVPVTLWLQSRGRSPIGAGIFGTAVLFASIHSTWPDPIALLLLALGLGWLAWRTGSLAAPMLVHALFNAVSVVQLLYWR